MHLALVHHLHRYQLVLVPHSSRNDSIAISLTPRLYPPDLSSQARVLDKHLMDESNSILIKTRPLMMVVRSAAGELALRLYWKRLVGILLGMERSTSKLKGRKPEVERAMIEWRYCDGAMILCEPCLPLLLVMLYTFRLYRAMGYFFY